MAITYSWLALHPLRVTVMLHDVRVLFQVLGVQFQLLALAQHVPDAADALVRAIVPLPHSVQLEYHLLKHRLVCF